MKGKLTLVFLVFAIQLKAQHLLFKDLQTAETIPGVAVKISFGKNQVLTLTSDQDGAIALEGVIFPATVLTQHINYQTQNLTISKDTTIYLVNKSTRLDDVVVTGQFAPTSAERSVFKVQRILKEEFEERGALTLEDALKSQLNLDIRQDLAIGSSTVSMQGINSQNVKILIDGIPLVNRNGNGNGADLSQINLQNIERIEIIEGPMAVNYGANALAGVINLITVDQKTQDPTGQIFIQSESAGDEIGLEEGRHIQGAILDFGISQNLSAQVSAQHNNFLGYQGDAGFRQYEWNPKRQYISDIQLAYQFKEHQLKYKFEYLNELIKDFGAPQNNILPTGENQPFAIDEEYKSERIAHQFLVSGQTKTIKQYNAYFSYSDFERISSQFSKNLVTGSEMLTTGEGDQDISGYAVFDAGGTINIGLASNLNLQLGYQVSIEEASGGRILEGSQQIGDYSLYSSAEWNLTKTLTLRPGLRYSHNSAYGNQAVPSLQAKWAVGEKDQIRFSFGQGFRAPSVRELYFEFIDSNHRIFGNPDLVPEQSLHYSVNYNHFFSLGGNQVKTELNFFYNDIDQQIGIAQSPTDATSTTYLNIEKFKTLGFNLSQSIMIGDLNGNVGFSYIGRYNRLSDTDSELESFFYTPEFNANLNYPIKNWGTSINLYYKYSGSIQTYFIYTNDEVSIGERDAFHWMDVSLNQRLNKRINVLVGAKNLLNIQNINNSGVGGGAHSGGPSQPISYGRSYFIKLNYNINQK